MTCRKTPKNTRCSPEPQDNRPVYPPFSLCLPFGGRLSYDGTGLRHTPGPAVPDGIYGRFSVLNGCLTGVLPEAVPVYTPPPCGPSPGPCNETGGGVIIAPGANNLTSLVSGRLLTELHAENGANVSITGDGTAASPLKISSTVTPNDTKEL